MTHPLILILDDSELIVGMLEMICMQLGYRCISATEFAQVANVIAAENPSIILSDLNLPKVPGEDPIAALRTLPALTQTPIIVISGRPQAELNAVAKERGAQGAVSKDAGLPGMLVQLEPLLSSLLS